MGFVLAVCVAELKATRFRLWMGRWLSSHAPFVQRIEPAPQLRLWMTRLFFPALSTLVFAAGVISGWPPYWGRLPGPYLVSASERSIEPQGMAAAQWARFILGPNNRMAADLTNHLLMGSLGKQNSTYGLSEVYFSPQIGEAELYLLQHQQIRYLIVDRRLSTGLPIRGYYFNEREPNANAYARPIGLEALDKFDRIQRVNRIFDSGDIIIYDVRALSNAR